MTLYAADVVVVATGSQPAGTGFQRFLPGIDPLPGIERGNVWSIEEVMARSARPGRRVVLVDDGGNWRGGGTAWHLAEQGHEVTLVAAHAQVGAELVRSTADFPLRRRLAQLGTRLVTDSAVNEWHGDAATIVSLLDGSEERVACDALVLATPNVAETALLEALSTRDIEVHAVGDCVAPRWAVHAIYEGRKLARAL